PDDTTASYSRASCSAEASRHQSTSWLGTPDMAGTTTATSGPASTSRLTWRATLRMRSISETEVPPNFMTRQGMALAHVSGRMSGENRYYRKPPREKEAIHTGGGGGPQPREQGR